MNKNVAYAHNAESGRKVFFKSLSVHYALLHQLENKTIVGWIKLEHVMKKKHMMRTNI